MIVILLLNHGIKQSLATKKNDHGGMIRVLIDFSSQLDIIWSMKKRESGESKCNASILRSHWADGLKTWRETVKSEQQTNIRSDPSYV